MKSEVFHGTKPELEKRATEILAAKAPDPTELRAAIDAAFLSQQEWRRATQNAFDRLTTAGRMLRAQKTVLKHGEWLLWLTANLPDAYAGDEDHDAAVAAWIRTAQNWMRISVIIDGCHPEVLETAHTVAQLFRLAQFLPESSGAPGEEESELAPEEIATRVKRWITSNGRFLAPDRLRTLPEPIRADLRDQLAPIWEVLAL